VNPKVGSRLGQQEKEHREWLENLIDDIHKGEKISSKQTSPLEKNKK
jgi:hypothetical protein